MDLGFGEMKTAKAPDFQNQKRGKRRPIATRLKKKESNFFRKGMQESYL